jgi:hypothetical protein
VGTDGAQIGNQRSNLSAATPPEKPEMRPKDTTPSVSPFPKTAFGPRWRPVANADTDAEPFLTAGFRTFRCAGNPTQSRVPKERAPGMAVGSAK